MNPNSQTKPQSVLQGLARLARLRVTKFLASVLARVNDLAVLNGSWGRGDEPKDAKPADGKTVDAKPSDNKPQGDKGSSPPPRPPKRGDEPPDLEEVWRDFNKKLGQLFGNKPKRPSSSDLGPKANNANKPNDENGNGSGNQDNPNRGGSPTMPSGNVIAMFGGAAALVALLLWLASGFYIVQEGQVAVISQFGKYDSTEGAGFHWRLPAPIQANETVDISRVRKVEIGTRAKTGAARLKEALMLTDDENIVDVQFEVQYRIRDNGAPGFIYSARNPEGAVMQAAESAMREEVGRRTIDEVLNKGRSEISAEVQKRLQVILDRYKIKRTDVAGDLYFDSGIQITAVAIQNAQPPEQVQAAFDDAVKAVQDKERAINEGQAYANDVVPRAKGAASRLLSEAEGYKQRVVQTAEGDAARFKSVVTEYAKAPVVTRQRMYLDTMQKVFESTSKVVVDTKGSGNMLYLPLDKIMSQNAESARAASSANGASSMTESASAPAVKDAAVATPPKDSGLRTRDLRDLR